MRRLIDADELKELYTVEGLEGKDAVYHVALPVIRQNIDDMPTIDPIHAAGGCYCRECKSFMEYTEEYKAECEGADGDCFIKLMHCADRQFAGVTKDDFCSYGRRRMENK